MKKFLYKLLLLSSPIIILLIFFVVLDPFMIMRDYDNYYGRSDWENRNIPPNWDYVSSETYMKNAEKYKYNSFIFGSSRTLAYKTDNWIKYLDSNSVPFVFGASSESIFGIYTKIKYINETGGRIKNAMVIIDLDWNFDFEHHGHLFLKHPAIAHTSWLNFYSEYIKSYFDPDFLWNYYKYILTKNNDSLPSDWVWWSKLKFDAVTNQMQTFQIDEQINRDPKGYYEKWKSIFYSRDTVQADLKPKISEEHIEMFRGMKEIFDKQHTNYKIIISPLYNQVKFNKADLQRLYEIFGAGTVFDFSGRNSFTEPKEDYYEASHYRSFIADSIMSIIYKK